MSVQTLFERNSQNVCRNRKCYEQSCREKKTEGNVIFIALCSAGERFLKTFKESYTVRASEHECGLPTVPGALCQLRAQELRRRTEVDKLRCTDTKALID